MRKIIFISAVSLGLSLPNGAFAQNKVEVTQEKPTLSTTEGNLRYEPIEIMELPEPVKEALQEDYFYASISEAYKSEANTYKITFRAQETEDRGAVFANASGKWIPPNDNL